MRVRLVISLATVFVGPAGTGAAWAIGPSFDCSKANTPLAELICASPALSSLDLQFSQAYYALRHQAGATGQAALMKQAVGFQAQVKQACQLLDSGAAPAITPALTACITREYQGQRAAWLASVSGAAQQEANRPIAQHVALQGDLRTLGYLPSNTSIDGVYGYQTRSAIVAWQYAQNEPTTGFITDADASAIEQQAAAASNAGGGADQGILQQQQQNMFSDSNQAAQGQNIVIHSMKLVHSVINGMETEGVKFDDMSSNYLEATSQTDSVQATTLMPLLQADQQAGKPPYYVGKNREILFQGWMNDLWVAFQPTSGGVVLLDFNSTPGPMGLLVTITDVSDGSRNIGSGPYIAGYYLSGADDTKITNDIKASIGTALGQ